METGSAGQSVEGKKRCVGAVHGLCQHHSGAIESEHKSAWTPTILVVDNRSAEDKHQIFSVCFCEFVKPGSARV